MFKFEDNFWATHFCMYSDDGKVAKVQTQQTVAKVQTQQTQCEGQFRPH